MSAAWQWFVAIVVVVSVIAHWVFLLATSKKTGAIAHGEDSTTGHVWDNDLEERNLPLPRWWLFVFHGTLIFAVLYMVLYPGSGIFAGTLGWSQVSQYEAEVAANEARYGEIFAAFAAKDIPALAQDEDAMSAGYNLFANNCAQCHGSDGRGAVSFPNLTDGAWLHGGEPEQILASINNGRIAAMPPWGAALGDEGVEQVVQHVLAISGQDHDASLASAGAQKYGMFCIACHGADGTGNVLLGAPNLTDEDWLYDPTEEAIRRAITQGLNNEMPGFQDKLGPERTKVLAAYVYGLSR